MADQNNKPAPRDERSLREISHLFLSSVRDKATNGAAPPQRKAPAKPRTDAIDYSAAPVAPPAPIAPGVNQLDRIAPVSAVIASHLNGHQRDRVREYAAHLCKTGERVGLIELDAAELRLSCFELGSVAAASETNSIDQMDGRKISESLEEMSWDIDRWLVLLPNPRSAEARALLQQISKWTVLATCDHDGVVSCYRCLKGLAEVEHASTPTLSLALLDADDEVESTRVFEKLAAVCQQFLKWPLESEPAVLAAGSVVEHEVLTCHASRDASRSCPQWKIVSGFVARSRSERAEEVEPVAQPIAPKTQNAPPAGVAISEDESPPMQLKSADDARFSEVIDLPVGADAPATIVFAVVHGDSTLVECPVKPPMLPEATLAVARDRRLILLAVAQQGLSDLRKIAETWRWMNENRALIAMAVPQLSIDAHQMPHLRLLIDRADVSAEILQPLLQAGNVTVQTYRKLRWGEKTGLLLEAA